jgi:hypothetical protein
LEARVKKDDLWSAMCHVISGGIALKADYEKLIEICDAFADTYEFKMY